MLIQLIFLFSSCGLFTTAAHVCTYFVDFCLEHFILIDTECDKFKWTPPLATNYSHSNSHSDKISMRFGEIRGKPSCRHKQPSKALRLVKLFIFISNGISTRQKKVLFVPSLPSHSKNVNKKNWDLRGSCHCWEI